MDKVIFTELNSATGACGLITFLDYECTIRDSLSGFKVPEKFVNGKPVVIDTLLKSGPGRDRFLECAVLNDGRLDLSALKTSLADKSFVCLANNAIRNHAPRSSYWLLMI